MWKKNNHCECGKKIGPTSINCRSCAVKKVMKTRDPIINEKIRVTCIKRGLKPPITHRTGKQNPAWKGDKVGYWGIHDWVTRKLGQPRYCAYCQSNDKKGPLQYQWANISHSYRRDLSDWIRLCASCHKLFDLGKIKLII